MEFLSARPVAATEPLSADERRLTGLFGGYLKTFVAVIFALVMIVVVKMRRRILFLLTGDDKLRVNQFCCCTNSCISAVCCCFPNSPTRYVATYFGMYPLAVTLEDVVIGNIPLE